MEQVPASKRDFVENQQELLHEQLSAAWQLHVERVQEHLGQGWQTHLGRIVEERFREFSERFADEVRSAIDQRTIEQDELAATNARLKWSQQLSQIARRLESAEDLPAWNAALLDGALAVAPRAFLFSLLSGELASEGHRAPENESYPTLFGLKVPLDSARAFQGAAESFDTVIALGNSAEISQTLLDAFSLDESCRIALLPIATGRGQKQRKVAAILAIPGHQVPADIPALELLASVAGLSLDTRQAAQQASKLGAGQLLGIAPNTEPKVPVNVVPDVARLPRDEQETHARAQRFARVRVAEMRLYRAQSVKEGREKHDLYGALQKEIDLGREQFRQEFVSTPTMIDYFHVELVRTLANDDASLLGPGYPGPLV